MDEHGKRVSWVELYLDLIFVLAVGQLSHLIVHEPKLRSVWIALGLFMMIWWTWIGFAVLYNRKGKEGTRMQPLFLAGSVPAGVAAVAIGPAAAGDSTVFVISLAATRVALAACANADDETSHRMSMGYLGAAALLLVSLAVPEPFRYAVWAIAIAGESGQLLREDREGVRRARHNRDWDELKPKDPGQALDAHHFAERFGLFLIILLGEVLVEAGQAATAVEAIGTEQWLGLIAAMLLAGGLWWLYFDAAAELNLKVLELSGGSPTMARAIFAVGHMVPAFSLLVISAGIGLLLEHEPPNFAYAAPAIGLGAYLLGTRVFMSAKTHTGRVLRVLLLIAIFNLGRLHDTLSGVEYVWLLAAIGSLCATLSSAGSAFLSRLR